MSDALAACGYMLLTGIALRLFLWGDDRRREHAAALAAAESEREREARAIDRIYTDWLDARNAERDRKEQAEHRAYMEMRAEKRYRAMRRAMREEFGMFDQDYQPAALIVDGECQRGEVQP